MYTIGDFLIQIKNGYMSRKKEITTPYSKAVASIGDILVREGYVKKVSTRGGSAFGGKNEPARHASASVEGGKFKVASERKVLVVELLYKGKNSAINEIKLVSKPSVHHYFGSKQIKKRVSKHGIGILSTNRGIMTSRDAQKSNVGGELICQIF